MLFLIYVVFTVSIHATEELEEVEVDTELLGVELEEEEPTFESLFIYYDIENLETGLGIEVNETKEQKLAFEWPNSTEAYILSIAGLVSCILMNEGAL